jgi:hypothetical protein
MSEPNSADYDRTLLYGPPLIIDPDDQEQMERFARLHDEAWQRVRDRNPSRVGTPTWEIVAEQFRLFKDPNYRAQLDEPEGIGAVVEDANGDLWVRLNETHWYSTASPNNNQTWGELDARKLLSEGVFPPGMTD